MPCNQSAVIRISTGRLRPRGTKPCRRATVDRPHRGRPTRDVFCPMCQSKRASSKLGHKRSSGTFGRRSLQRRITGPRSWPLRLFKISRTRFQDDHGPSCWPIVGGSLPGAHETVPGAPRSSPNRMSAGLLHQFGRCSAPWPDPRVVAAVETETARDLRFFRSWSGRCIDTRRS